MTEITFSPTDTFVNLGTFIVGGSTTYGDVTSTFLQNGYTVTDETGTGSLISFWSLDTSSATDHTDANTGSVNGPTNQAGTLSRDGMDFDGVDDNIDLGRPTNLDFSGTNAFTIAAWAYPTSTVADEVIFSRGGAHTANDSMVYNLTKHTSDSDRWQTVVSDGTDKIQVNVDGSLDQDQWQFVVSTWDGTDLKLYKNGSLIGQDTKSSFSLWDGGGTDKNRNTAIGKNARNDSDFWEGMIDEVRIYDRALTSTEISNLYSLNFNSQARWKDKAFSQQINGKTLLLKEVDPKTVPSGSTLTLKIHKTDGADNILETSDPIDMSQSYPIEVTGLTTDGKNYTAEITEMSLSDPKVSAQIGAFKLVSQKPRPIFGSLAFNDKLSLSSNFESNLFR